jgi:hypothetical protein
VLMCLVNFSIACSVDDGCSIELAFSCEPFRIAVIIQM